MKQIVGIKNYENGTTRSNSNIFRSPGVALMKAPRLLRVRVDLAVVFGVVVAADVALAEVVVVVVALVLLLLLLSLIDVNDDTKNDSR